MKTDFQLFPPGFKTLIKTEPQWAPKTKRTAETTCGIAHILGILLMNSYDA